MSRYAGIKMILHMSDLSLICRNCEVASQELAISGDQVTKFSRYVKSLIKSLIKSLVALCISLRYFLYLIFCLVRFISMKCMFPVLVKLRA